MSEAPVTWNMPVDDREGLAARLERLAERFAAMNVQERVVLEVVQGHHARFERIEATLASHEDILREILAAVTTRR